MKVNREEALAKMNGSSCCTEYAQGGCRNGPGLFLSGLMLMVFSVACILVSMMPATGHAAASPCAVEFHKQALSLAIEYAPRDLKNSIRVQEALGLKQT